MNGWFSIGLLSGCLSCKLGDIVVLVDFDNCLGFEVDVILKVNLDFKVVGYIKLEVSLLKEVYDVVKFFGCVDNEGWYLFNF